jgi:hypothetical protein
MIECFVLRIAACELAQIADFKPALGFLETVARSLATRPVTVHIARLNQPSTWRVVAAEV